MVHRNFLPGGSGRKEQSRHARVLQAQADSAMDWSRRLPLLLCLSAACTWVGVADARSPRRQPDAAQTEGVTGGHSNLALQVALDRARFSPGPMDGNRGANTSKALKAFQRAQGLNETGRPDAAVWKKLSAAANEAPLVEYVISDKDVAGPFEPKIPESLEEKAKLERLAYTGPEELLAEKFHMDIALLKRLNQGRRFDHAGTVLRVTNLGRLKATKAARIEVDKGIGGVFVFDRQDTIIAFPDYVQS